MNGSRSSLRADETGILDREELESARRVLTPEQFAQEFLCSFDAAIVGAYFAKELDEAQNAGRIGDVPYDPLLPVHTAWDLGVGDRPPSGSFRSPAPRCV